jgi:hypothetical protein
MVNYIEIPTWNNGVWETTDFKTRDEYKSFVESLFKEPGKYEFDETTFKFNEQARRFQEKGFYCEAPLNSKDYIKYWGALFNEDILSEKSKCRKGVIFKNKNKTWYLTRDYYFWINFLPIFDKEKQKFDFPNVWDSQYHTALYELIAELNYKHVAILKKRQFGSSYFHMSKLINQFWFEEGRTLKIGASLKDYINEKGCWKFLNEYRNFLNTHAWYRGCDPDKTLTWQQRVKINREGRDTYQGGMSIILGSSFEKDPTSGVGGNVTYFYHEEAGIAPKMNTTYEFIRPALASGMITTGTFIAAGSVGDLSQCQPLKEMIMKPDANSIQAVETTLLDNKGTFGRSGLFIPEQWSMPPCIDEYGNSLVEEALEMIIEERKKWKKDLTPALYQLRISQKPINIYEAFAYREESIWPLHLVNRQIQRIEDKEYPVEYVDLERDGEGKIQIKNSNRSPILDFPVPKSLEDKSGIICMHERPVKDIPFGMYYASVDPLGGENKTTTSESLFCIYIYRTIMEITTIDTNNKVDNKLEDDKIVAWWTGRFDDLKKTHERAEMLIEIYKARTIVESNFSTFTNYMINQKKQHMLVPRGQLLDFNRDLKADSQAFQEYGWRNSKPVFQHLLTYGINYLKEVLAEKTKDDGTVLQTIYGITRIPDIMLLKEMVGYGDGSGNFDRIVSFCALIAYAKIQQANLGVVKKYERKQENLEKSGKFNKFLSGGPEVNKPRNPYAKPNRFKHFR